MEVGAEADLVLTETSLLFKYKTYFQAYEGLRGFYRNKVTTSLTSIHRLGCLAFHCKFEYELRHWNGVSVVEAQTSLPQNIRRDKERGEMAISPCKVRCFVKLHYGTLLGDVLAFSISLLKVLAGNWMKLAPQTDP